MSPKYKGCCPSSAHQLMSNQNQKDKAEISVDLFFYNFYQSTKVRLQPAPFLLQFHVLISAAVTFIYNISSMSGTFQYTL